MNLKRTLLVAQKNLIETVRDPILMILLIVLPAFFMAITYIGYGHTPKTATYRVLLLANTTYADELIDILRKASYEDGRPYFQVEQVSDRSTAETELKDKTAALLFILEEDRNGQLSYTSRGDAMNMQFIKASAQLEAIAIPWLEHQQGKPERYLIEPVALDRPRPVSDFEAYVPGMMIFALLLIIPQTAMLIGKERRKGTLKRLNLSLLRPVEILGGISLAQMVIAVMQVVIMLVFALALGFQNRGSILLAALIGCLIAFGSVGMGLILGCFMKNDTDALNTGSSISMIQVFFSGAFFAMPSPIIGHWMNHPIAAFDFFPATNGMVALQQVLSGGADFAQVSFRMAATAVLSFIFFLMGVLFYRHFTGIER